MVLGGLLATGLAVSGFAAQAPYAGQDEVVPAAAGKKLIVIQQNTDEKKVTFDRVLATADKKGAKADAITFQEVCESWVTALPKKWTWKFGATKAGACDDGTAKGVAVLARSKFTQRGGDAFDLRKDKGRTPKLACLYFDKGGLRHDVCSTHLVAYGRPRMDQDAEKIRLKQAKQIKKRTNGWIEQGHLVVLGGDLNAPPRKDPLTHLYATPNGKGKFTEAAQLGGKGGKRGGKITSVGRNQKIDYLFFSRNHVPASNAGGLTLKKHGAAGAGHKMLIARARVS